ncbi:branched-chain amino acid ABC transporter permease [Caproiciproducens sp. R1]|uniref:branched-chain amino acid ABC transporter permease n=1 Tax=Caproiciproducens sp. R1 TaxID=3435000 RepID=UPI004033C3C5
MSGYLQGIIILVGINLIAVLGVSILTGFTKLFSFGNAGFMSIGAYTCAILTTRYNVPFIVAIIAGAAFAGLVGYGLGSLTLGLQGDYFLITTLGFGECVRVLFEYITPVTGGAKGFSGIPHYTNIWIVLISVILAFIFAWTLTHSKYGRNLTAIREQEVAAQAVGVDTAKNKLMAFVVSAVYAGWAGALYANSLTFLEPKIFNLAKSSELTITTVIGGLGSLTGSFLGTCVVTLLPEIFRSLSSYRMLLYGIAVVVIIIVRPSGLYGYKEFSITRIGKWFKRLGKKAGDAKRRGDVAE